MQAVVRTYTNKWTVRVEAFNSLCGSTAWQKWCSSHALPCSFFFWASTAACFKGTQPSSLCLIWMTSICRQFVEAEVRQQFQPHKINLTGIPVNKIIHSTFKTHWQLWHMGKQHNTEKAQTRSDWHIYMAVRPPFSHFNIRHGETAVCAQQKQQPAGKVSANLSKF